MKVRHKHQAIATDHGIEGVVFQVKLFRIRHTVSEVGQSPPGVFAQHPVLNDLQSLRLIRREQLDADFVQLVIKGSDLDAYLPVAPHEEVSRAAEVAFPIGL